LPIALGIDAFLPTTNIQGRREYSLASHIMTSKGNVQSEGWMARVETSAFFMIYKALMH
jgi:hypothetical protein